MAGNLVMHLITFHFGNTKKDRDATTDTLSCTWKMDIADFLFASNKSYAKRSWIM